MRGGVESTEEAKSDERTTGRKSAKGRTIDYRGSATTKPKPEPSKQRGAGKKNKVEKTWAKRVKGRTKDESETADSNERNDSNNPNHMKSKQTRRRPKTMPRRKSRRIKGCQSHKARKRPSTSASKKASNQEMLEW